MSGIGGSFQQNSHGRIIHSSRPSYSLAPFHALSIDAIKLGPQAFQLALQLLTLLRCISDLLCDSEFSCVQLYDLCCMPRATVMRDDGLLVL